MDVKTESTAASVDTASKPPRSNRKLLLIVVGLLVLLLIAGTTTYLVTKKKNYVFVVNGKTYTAQEIKPMTDYLTKYTGVSLNDATKKVYEMEQYKAAAELAGAQPSAQELSNELKSTTYTSSLSYYKPWFDLVSYYNAVYVPTDPSTLTQGSYKGYSYIFPFFNAIDKTPAYTSPYYGDSARLASDKEYAKQQAQSYLNSLKTNKVSYDQALISIQADPKLGYEYQAGTNTSSKFGYGSGSWQYDLTTPQVRDFISKQTKPGLSAIQTGQISVLGDNDKSTPQDGFYFFVYLSSANKAKSDLSSSLNSSLQKVKANSKYN